MNVAIYMSCSNNSSKNSLSIKFNLLFQMSMEIVVILLLSTLSFFQMNKLRKLQDESYSRSQDEMLAEQASSIDDVLYKIIADSVINHVWQVLRHSGTRKALAVDLLSRVVKVADTPDEKKWSNDAKSALDSFISVYENEMIPILNSNDYSMDKIHVFDNIRASSIRLNLIISIIASILLLGFCLLIILSIVNPIGYAVKVLETVASGDLEKSVAEKYRTNDEIGKLLSSTDKIIENIRKIINGVVRESNTVNCSINDPKNQLLLLRFR